MSYRTSIAVALSLLFAIPAVAPAQTPGGRWVTTWGTAEVGRPQNPFPAAPAPPPFMANTRCAPPAAPPVAPPPGQVFAPPPYPQLTNQTVRQIVRSTIAGSRARVVVSNAYGTTPMTIGAAHLALRDKGDAIKAPGRALMFSGRPTITIPANAVVYSDPVDLAIPQLADIAIDLYLPGTTNTAATTTVHTGALQTSYVSETGNHVGKPTLPTAGTVQSWFLLSRLDVQTTDAAGAIVAFGDSITDGARSTPDTNNRWPDHLAQRLLGQNIKMAVINAGIGGNRVLGEGVVPAGTDVRAVGAGMNALARFERHVLSNAGITHVIILEGINDIGNARANASPTAEDLIAGHKQLIEQAHARGLKIYGATLTPFWGAAYYTEVGEAKRQALNEWIRTSGAYDGVIDFDKATRDPGDPKKFLEKYDSCDYLHPSDAGYKAMGEAIDLSLFRSSAPPSSVGR